MATKSKTAVAKSDEQKALARIRAAEQSLRPSISAASSMLAFLPATYGEVDLQKLVTGLSESMKELNGGDLTGVENMLFGQAHALQSIFVNLARKAANQEYLKQYETHMRLALKAQSQCRATLETLAAIKNPPLIFAKQANIANGPQQINNGTAAPSHAQENEIEQSKLLESQHGNYLDSGATGATISGNQAMATMGKLDRPEVGKRQSESIA